MPEGDTVFALAARLRRDLDGRTVVRSSFRVPAHATADVAGSVVLGHETHGKHLLTRFGDGRTLHTHLRMDGSWTVTRQGRRLPRRLLPDVRLLLEVDGGSTAYGLRLPVVDLVATADERDVIGHLGPDPLRADWDAAEAVRRLCCDPSRAVADALLDQRLVAGFGNLWANELCFLRGLDPRTPVGEVDLPALVALGARALHASAHRPGQMQVTTGVRRRGEQHWVTGRAGRPCLRCGTVVRVVDGVDSPSGRRTWWCPSCQPARVVTT
ncbi:Fpg/Nei family DNA glycosylase [Jatrophihabitans fulvus]